ncbi:hypothetical protein [Nitrosomonas sp. ANs5]|uniref:hypothetical protein n=1 Tax=Nitrosomonas sp. ANs5 TaxID=3423941 RepID=UPI003D330249
MKLTKVIQNRFLQYENVIKFFDSIIILAFVIYMLFTYTDGDHTLASSTYCPIHITRKPATIPKQQINASLKNQSTLTSGNSQALVATARVGN